jgi:hypothetical protein
MYMLEGLIEDVVESNLEEGESKEFASPTHRFVFMNICLCNPRVTQADQLINAFRIINKIQEDQIRKVTSEDLKKLGCNI